MCQSRRTVCGASSHRDVTIDILVSSLRNPDLQKFQTARYPREQIIEVVSEAPCKLANRFHLLGLAQCILCLREGVLLKPLLGDVSRDAIQQPIRVDRIP